MTEYVCTRCNLNCLFDEDEFEEYDGVLCPYIKDFTELMKE